MHEDDFEFDDPDYKSKTQVKEEMHELRRLGLELSELPLSILDTIEMDSELRAAIDDYRRITHKNALKRQASFVGKMLRKHDSDSIRAQLEALHESRHKATRQFHLVEQWRDKLIESSGNALEEFLSEYPNCDRQQLRSLIRAAQKDKTANKPPTSARKVFKFIQQCFAEAEE